MNKSLSKALGLLELVANRPIGLVPLAAALDMPKSTAHRFASQLVDEDYLQYDGSAYSLGYKLLELGERAKSQLQLPKISHASMQRLADRTNETVHLGQLHGSEIVYIQKVEGRRGLQMASYVGLRTPAQYTAMGKALMAFSDELLSVEDLVFADPRTPNSITSKAAFRRELDEIRVRGYAVDREENEIGVRCIAAPIWGPSGAIASVSLSGAAIYVTPAREEELVPELFACAEAITRAAGGNYPKVGAVP